MEIKQLNKTELQIMKCLWKLEKGFMKDIIEQLPEPRPAYTTVATLVSRMCDKGYIGFDKLGRDKQYYPQLKKQDYFSDHVKTLITHFFNNSAGQFASFFTRNTDLSVEELEELQNLVKKQLSEKNNQKK